MKKNKLRVTRQNNSGFTFVEVIIVAVIVAVLAAIAVPIYTSYITAQKQATVENLATTGAAAANSYFRRTGSDPSVSDLNLFISDEDEYTVTVDAGANTVKVEDSDGNSSTVSY